MSLSESNRARISYQRESVVGEKPSPFNAQVMRLTGEDFKADKQTDTSKELRADRMVSDQVLLGFSSGGKIDTELSLGGALTPFIESAVSGTFGNAVDFSGSATFTAATKNILAVGAFASAVVGQYILVTGTASNNGWKKIVTVTDNDNVVVESTLVDETVASAIKGSMARNGVVKHSYTIEKAFLDIGVYQLFKGQHLSKWDLTASSRAIITSSFEFLGMGVESATSTYTDSTVAADSSDVVSASTNMGCITIDGTVSDTPIKEISVSVDNAVRELDATCSQYAVGINQGQQKVTGKFQAYFKNKDIFDKFINHDALALSFGFVDSLGNGIRITLPRVKLTSNPIAASGIDNDVMQDVDFAAIMDATTNCQIQIDVA